jgi:hypothetical protein
VISARRGSVLHDDGGSSSTPSVGSGAPDGRTTTTRVQAQTEASAPVERNPS